MCAMLHETRTKPNNRFNNNGRALNTSQKSFGNKRQRNQKKVNNAELANPLPKTASKKTNGHFDMQPILSSKFGVKPLADLLPSVDSSKVSTPINSAPSSPQRTSLNCPPTTQRTTNTSAPSSPPASNSTSAPSSPQTSFVSTPSSPKRKIDDVTQDQVEVAPKRQCCSLDMPLKVAMEPIFNKSPMEEEEEDIEIDIVGDDSPNQSYLSTSHDNSSESLSWSDADEKDMKLFGLDEPVDSGLDEQDQKDLSEFLL